MSKTDVADEVPPQNPSSPVEQSTCEPSRKSATGPFPRRLKLEGFPASPAPGSSRVPVTLENVGHLLDECGIEVGYDVIKKAVSVRRGSAILEETDLLSLGNLNGMGSNLLLDFVGTLARRKPVNPVADWINSKPWDNVDRLSDFYNTVAVQSGFPEPSNGTISSTAPPPCLPLWDQLGRTFGFPFFQGAFAGEN